MRKMFTKVLIVFVSFLLLSSCRKDIDKYYERPDYLRGNAYEFLKERGNYTLFLAALGKVGKGDVTYKDALDGRGLYSVFAPDDDAFRRYMAAKGKASLEDFDKDSLEMLVGYHLIEFSFNRNDFLAFSKTASAEEPTEGDGSCYKFETLAQEKVSTMIDPLTQRSMKIYHQRKFLPVISTTLLRTQESNDYEGDYKVFFPNIKWQGDVNQLYVANAAVIESGIPIDNGYMYLVNEVIEPLPTVYEALKASRPGSSFKIFRELYDRFAYLPYDPQNTQKYAELGDSLFNFYHYLAPSGGDDLPDLANEWPVPEYSQDYEARLRFAFNCFAPTDEVLLPYIQNFFGVTNYEDVPLLNLLYLLKAHSPNRQKLMLPSVLDKGVEGLLGEEWTVERKNLVATQLCSNGVLYGIDKVLEPAVFSMMMKPFFQYPRFSTMLNMAHKDGVFTTMIDPEREFTAFLVANDVLESNYGYRVNYNGNPGDPDVVNGRVTIEGRLSSWFDGYQGSDIGTMPAEVRSAFINTQLVNGYVNPDKQKDKRIFYPTRNPFHFIYTENGAVYGENNVAVNIKETWEFNYQNGGGRGVTYEVNDKFKVNQENIGMALFKQADKYQKFYAALLGAKLIQLKPDGVTNAADVKAVEMDWLKGERCLVFAPTNAAWDETILPVDSVELDRFLKYFFIPMTENKMTDYILPNYGTLGQFDTRFAYSPSRKAKMSVYFVDDKKLSIENGLKTSTAFTDGNVPFFAQDGLIYGITSMITAKD